jgi:flagellar motor component MotA
VLFTLGAIILIFGGFIGSDGGFTRVANIAALSIGSSIMISGAIIGGFGIIKETMNDAKSILKNNHDELVSIIGIPEAKLPKIKKAMITSAEAEKLREEYGKFAPITETEGWTFNGTEFDNEEAAKEAEAKYREKYGRA